MPLHIRPARAIQKLEPYRLNAFSYTNLSKDGILKLDWNECTIPPSPHVIQAIESFFKQGNPNWYPDPAAEELEERLAEYVDCKRENILVFNGSDSALDHLCRTYLESDDPVVISAPTYDHFRVFSIAAGGAVRFFRADPIFRPDPEGLIRFSGKEARIIYIANPNNPTGVMYDSYQIEQILTALPAALLVVDEAYYEFTGMTVSGCINQYPNLAVTRSFSKAFGLAGLRVGYVVACEELLSQVSKLRNGKDVNSIAQVAAVAALEDMAYMEAYVEQVQEARKYLTEALTAMGMETVSSPANFILIRVAEPAGVQEALKKEKIYVRDRSYITGLEYCIRVTVGTRADSERFLKAFQNIPENFLSSP